MFLEYVNYAVGEGNYWPSLCRYSLVGDKTMIDLSVGAGSKLDLDKGKIY